MIRVIIFTILALVLIAFIIARIESLSKNTKIIICVLCTLLVAGVIIYQLSVDKRSDINRELVSLFGRGEKLVCKKYEVDNTKFNYVGGTKVFVGLDNFSDVKGVVIPIEECRLK